MALKFITLTLFVAAVCAQQQQSALGPALIQQQAANPNQSAQQNQSQQHRDEHQQHQQQHPQQHQQPQHPHPEHPQQHQQNEHHQQQQHQQQQHQQQHHDQADRYEHDPQYDYSYIVQDNLTGDNKQQEESRRGGRVRGQYSLIDADGFRRIVDYRADDHTGFNAEVRREPIGHGRVQRIEQRIEQIDRQSQQHHNNQQSQQNQQNANNQHHSIEQSRQSVQNTFQRIEVPASAFPRSVYTVQEFVAPSYSAVRQSVHTNRQDDNQNQQNQQNQQQNQQQQHQESRYQARLTFRSPGINYQY